MVLVDKEGRGPTQRALAAERQQWEGRDVTQDIEPRFPNVSVPIRGVELDSKGLQCDPV